MAEHIVVVMRSPSTRSIMFIVVNVQSLVLCKEHCDLCCCSIVATRRLMLGANFPSGVFPVEHQWPMVIFRHEKRIPAK
ncbi:hypothetical protein NPIL_540251 [Nephila pilipes]|uniref:Uncharacterized protein n=1 Tax=Nephila pilipes TaxID=299642 RepID=A0A8X6N480_NEPPI|nr:hypothetical protein NPIL_540251 [Nephila pilipes]